MFEKVVAAPADPILGLTEAFRSDPRQDKINLGVGIYKDESGATPILKCVKLAEQKLLTDEKTKNYLGIEGNQEYARIVQGLLFGKGAELINAGRAKTAQAPGGTGALRIAAEFIARNQLSKTVWISDPTWANHVSVFQAAGLEVKWYKYYDATSKDLDFAAMQASLSEAQRGDVVLFHGCCHNPTGIDPTAAQWEALAKQSAAAGWLPLFDFAYQGFARGIEEDAEGLRIFARSHRELLVASSFSKNFGLYNERVGAFTLVADSKEVADTAFTQVKTVIRANYSNPPSHGAAVVTAVVNDPALFELWVSEVAEMRVRIREMRELLVAKLAERGVNQDFSFIARQNGMFSFSGLSKEQVARLKDEFAIYIVGSGRISVAGITRANIDPLCDAIAKVL
ncbi:amino acid aminotransferase [Aeromonas simiae]|uniref:amino acid aminotransferase n=1 Tax=Aeromonas simiae TaxID=218936 RepID=UPI0005A82F41|nr:amino acid aminotransferase [Aeromonas simiae]MDO2947218.1 aspartate/tyrosine/aromatic aminotransferase [Aeromonas simiae]MDO2954827.1 aspartate/tyrosine/aromatic aminotransferase [Aeromonas simiae]